jgi:Tol biopolymer transport system component
MRSAVAMAVHSSVMGLASTALAGTGRGARFELGKTNTIKAISKLVGNVAGASLLIDNNSAIASATALDLRVEPGKAPMRVNPDASNLSVGVDNPTGDTEIFNVNLDGTDLRQLTNNTARDLHPDYAPDGRKLAFVSDRNFAPGIYTMSADGSKQKKSNRGLGVAFASPGWSPDGSRITFTSDQEGGHDVYVMRANGAGQQRLTVNGLPTDSGPVFSPDGAQIAFQTNRDGNSEIYAMSPNGEDQINLTNDPAGDFTPDWQPLQ